jgi:hypothetical protein
MSWDTPRFINGFCEGTLGKKKVHSGWRVIDADHCRVLVHATTKYGSPNGNEVYAIELKAQDERLVFLHPSNTFGHAYKIKRYLNIDRYQKLPSGYLKDDDSEILNSGIVALSEHHALIEFGDQPTLLCRRYMEGGAPKTMDSGQPKWASIEPLKTRVATIDEARELAKDPAGCAIIAKTWYAQPIDNPGEVPMFDPEYSKVLAAGVNPVDFGYQIEELSTEDLNENLCLLAVRGSIISNKVDKRSVSYLAAVAAYHEAGARLKKYQPIAYEGLTIKNDRYGPTPKQSSVLAGRIIATTKGVFIKGLIKSTEHWTEETTCTQWHRLEKKMKRKTMA